MSLCLENIPLQTCTKHVYLNFKKKILEYKSDCYHFMI